MAATRLSCASLMGLSRECRQMILKYLFKDSRVTPAQKRITSQLRAGDIDKHNDRSAILKTCKTLYIEGLQMYQRSSDYCLSRSLPQYHIDRLRLSTARFNIRSIIGFPISSSLGDWTEALQHFPALQTIVLENYGWVHMRPIVTLPFGIGVRPEDQHDMQVVTRRVCEYFTRDTKNLAQVIASRPHLRVCTVLNIIMTHEFNNPYHAVCLVDLLGGRLMKHIHSHTRCKLAQEASDFTSGLNRTCNPWDCEYFLSYSDIIDLHFDKTGDLVRHVNEKARLRSNKCPTFLEELDAFARQNGLLTDNDTSEIEYDHLFSQYSTAVSFAGLGWILSKGLDEDAVQPEEEDGYQTDIDML